MSYFNRWYLCNISYIFTKKKNQAEMLLKGNNEMLVMFYAPNNGLTVSKLNRSFYNQHRKTNIKYKTLWSSACRANPLLTSNLITTKHISQLLKLHILSVYKADETFNLKRCCAISLKSYPYYHSSSLQMIDTEAKQTGFHWDRNHKAWDCNHQA